MENTTKVIYVEEKGKPRRFLKLIMVLGWFLFVFGGLYGLSWGLSGNGPKGASGFVFSFLGFLSILVAKFVIWFNKKE